MPTRIKGKPLWNRKTLTFQELKYVILLWVPIHRTLGSALASLYPTLLVLIVATTYWELHGQAQYQMLPFIISPTPYNPSVWSVLLFQTKALRSEAVSLRWHYEWVDEWLPGYMGVFKGSVEQNRMSRIRHTYSQLLFNKGIKIIQWGKENPA